MKRFYQNVATAQAEGGFAVELDGRPIKTPKRRGLVLPTRALAELVADEWRAQGDTVLHHTMTAMRLAASVLDLLPERRPEVLDELLNYAQTDLLCYRADRPSSLVDRQTAHWDPWLRWLRSEHDIELLTTTNVQAVGQPAPSISLIRGLVEDLDDWSLIALHGFVRSAGSMTLGLAFLAGKINHKSAFDAAHLEEMFEREQWGEDPEQTARLSAIMEEYKMIEQWIDVIFKQNREC